VKDKTAFVLKGSEVITR